MKNDNRKKRMSMVVDGVEFVAHTEILLASGHGNLTKAVKSALAYMLDPQNLAKKEIGIICRAFLPTDIKERLLSGEHPADIADELMGRTPSKSKEVFPVRKSQQAAESVEVTEQESDETETETDKEDEPKPNASSASSQKTSKEVKKETSSNNSKNSKKTENSKKSEKVVDMTGGAINFGGSKKKSSDDSGVGDY